MCDDGHTCSQVSSIPCSDPQVEAGPALVLEGLSRHDDPAVPDVACGGCDGWADMGAFERQG